ncbi:MAG: LamG domain-containing, partial [Prolixibacteraceae bacterium]
ENEGDNPVYAWFVNDQKISGETDVTYAYEPKDGDEVYVQLTSSKACVIDPIAESDGIKIKVTDELPVAVDIKADKPEICEGETVTFTAIPENEGDNPVYAWFVNGTEVLGKTGLTYAYEPKDGDEVYVQLTSSKACVIDPIAESDGITIKVTDELPVAVDIKADKLEICEGETVTFTAIPENEGDNPVYAWFVNGIEIPGETNDIYSYQPKNNDEVYVKLTSSEACAINQSDQSIPIIINVIAESIVSVKIPEQTLVCNSEPVTLTATSENGGSNPVYNWFVNNVKIAGNNSATFTYTPNDKDEIFVTVESDVICVKDKTGTSNVVVISVGDIIPPVAKCLDITTYLDVEGKASITTAQIDNRSYDNCKLETLFLSRYDFDCADIGPNLVTLTAVDAVGLTHVCEAKVNVIDNIKPTVECKQNLPDIQLDENAEYLVTVDMVLVEGSDYDACGEVTTSVYPYELNCDNIGLTPFTLYAVDVNGNTAVCQTEIVIYGNIPPDVNDDIDSTLENLPVYIYVVQNDSDIVVNEKSNINYSSLLVNTQPKNGKAEVEVDPLTGKKTGYIKYTPNKNFTGVDVFQYIIWDDGIPCDPEPGRAWVRVTVKAVNDPPIAQDDYYDAHRCIPVISNVVLDNDNDDDGSENLRIDTNPLSPPIHGTVIIDPDGTISYFPNESYIGIDSFQYVIWDNGMPERLSDTAWVYINVDCSEETKDPLDCELFIPEGFSPNQDGIHDFFRIMCIHNYPDAKLMIFNRNGDLLWQRENYGNYDVWGDQFNAWWWGTSVLSRFDVGRQMINGEPKLKVGNYIYILELGNGERKNGTVMISY